MKNIKWMGTLALTAAGTLVAVLCASRWVPAQTASAARIAVASVDIDVGQRLTLIDCPTGKIPPGAFSDPHKLDGRVLRASVLHGEPLTESGLQPLALSAVRLHPGDLVAPAAARG
jgi:pilus assembly protein CpaB